MSKSTVQKWMPQKEELKPYYLGIHEFLEEYLPLPIDERTDTIQSKVIADPLIGYIHLSKLEVALMDTPLFQRLRNIKQLGLAHLVFPSLGYSRFEHSLGVVGRLNQILNRLSENYSRKRLSDLQPILKQYDQSIRLAALLHDIGHCLFSHCSERVINRLKGTESYPSSAKIIDTFSDAFNRGKQIPFAEIFAVSIIGSTRFSEFVSSVGDCTLAKAVTICEECVRFILGLPADKEPQSVFLAQLISSGIDVDKIDYMAREQLYTGIKLEIDLDRILSKLNVFDVDSFELPKQLSYLKRHFPAQTNKFKVLGFSKGGQFVFEEFCIARLALHVKVYLHQKVRAAESQLSTCLQSIAENESGLGEKELQKAHNWLRVPESVIQHPVSLDAIFKGPLTLFDRPIVSASQATELTKIDQRRIIIRSFAFGQMNSFSEGVTDTDATEQLENFFEQFNEDILRQSIRNEAIEIAAKLNLHLAINDLDSVIVDIPRLRFKSIQQGQESIFFERHALSPLKWTIPLDKIVIYYEENRALGYIYSNPAIAAIAGLAAEKIIFEISGKVFNQEGNVSQETTDQTLEYKRILTQHGHYHKLPELKDVSAYLKSADAAEKIKEIHERLTGFESLKKERITLNRITTFVNQFPEHLQDACLTFLQNLNLYNEVLLEKLLSNLISKRKLAGDVNIGIAYLGGVADSGGRLSYNLRSLFEEQSLEIRELGETLIQRSNSIIIYDDNINSGLQLLNILAELLDELENLPEKCRLNETHIAPLSSEKLKQKLRQTHLHFCYIIGYEGIEANIRDMLHRYLSFQPENIHIHIASELKLDEKVFSGSDSRFNHTAKRELKDYIKSIGQQLLDSEGKSQEKIESCALGYSHAEAMVLFPYNIPTMTITAIWLKGTINDGVPWIPLAERRRRRKQTGEFLGED